MPPLDEVSQLLRTGDASLVEADLVELLVSGEEEWRKDDRDLMMALAPYQIARDAWAPARPASASWSRSSAGART